jgi:hypothetical protein
MSDDDSEDYIDLEFKPRLVVSNRTPISDLCRHPAINVDERERTIRCRQCESLVDPFDWILGQVRSACRDLGWIKHLKTERGQLHAELADIKRQVKNAKAALRRARKKETDGE